MQSYAGSSETVWIVGMVTWTTILGFLLPYILSCTFFGLMLSCLVIYGENVMLLVVFTSVPLLFMTGISWRTEQYPGLLARICLGFPYCTFGIRGFLRIRQYGNISSDILPEFRGALDTDGRLFPGYLPGFQGSN